MWTERVASFLQRPDVVRWQILIYVNICSAYKRIRGRYETQRKRHETHFGLKPHSNRCHVATYDIWRPSPRLFKMFDLFRAFTTLYMVYILVKFALKHQIEQRQLEQFIHLDKPIHCYLLGRYILHESSAEMTAAFFSFLTLSWRLTRALMKPYRLNLVYFLVQDSRERDAIHRLFSSSAGGASFRLSAREFAQLSPGERFALDLMCYQVANPMQTVFVLRPNRTRAAHLELCRRVARSTLCAVAIITPIALGFVTVFSVMHLLDSRYLRVYPNCDPELERLHKAGQLDRWSMRLNARRLLTALFDHVENLVVWLECGLITFLGIATAHLVSLDLVLQGRGIERSIGRLETLLDGQLDARDRGPQVSLGPAYRQQVCQLTAEVADFFAQIAEADRFQSQVLNLAMVGWLSLCIFFTYTLRNNSADELPLPVAGLVGLCGAALTFSFYTFLMVHCATIKSYGRLCSLLARYPAQMHKLHFGGLLELYARQRDYFTLMDLYPFRTTTFLTVIGWTISLVCVITEVLRKQPAVKRAASFTRRK